MTVGQMYHKLLNLQTLVSRCDTVLDDPEQERFKMEEVMEIKNALGEYSKMLRAMEVMRR